MWLGRRMEKIKWSQKITNEEVLEQIGDNRTLLNNLLRRKANWIVQLFVTNDIEDMDKQICLKLNLTLTQ